ncbi:MAG: hypothetical protein J1F35_06670 [Erysipelotrichales bacterium]|nr:hypothetical protein [Erysipelotrichales bacterium]
MKTLKEFIKESSKIDHNVTKAKVKNDLNNLWKEVSNNKYEDMRSVIKTIQKSLDDKYGYDIVNINYYPEDDKYILEIEYNDQTIIKGHIDYNYDGSIENPSAIYDLVLNID